MNDAELKAQISELAAVHKRDREGITRHYRISGQPLARITEGAIVDRGDPGTRVAQSGRKEVAVDFASFEKTVASTSKASRPRWTLDDARSVSGALSMFGSSLVTVPRMVFYLHSGEAPPGVEGIDTGAGWFLADDPSKIRIRATAPVGNDYNDVYSANYGWAAFTFTPHVTGQWSLLAALGFHGVLALRANYSDGGSASVRVALSMDVRQHNISHASIFGWTQEDRLSVTQTGSADLWRDDGAEFIQRATLLTAGDSVFVSVAISVYVEAHGLGSVAIADYQSDMANHILPLMLATRPL